MKGVKELRSSIYNKTIVTNYSITVFARNHYFVPYFCYLENENLLKMLKFIPACV